MWHTCIAFKLHCHRRILGLNIYFLDWKSNFMNFLWLRSITSRSWIFRFHYVWHSYIWYHYIWHNYIWYQTFCASISFFICWQTLTVPVWYLNCECKQGTGLDKIQSVSSNHLQRQCHSCIGCTWKSFPSLHYTCQLVEHLSSSLLSLMCPGVFACAS